MCFRGTPGVHDFHSVLDTCKLLCVPLLSSFSLLLVSPGHYYSGGLMPAPGSLELSSSGAAAGAAYLSAPSGSHPHTPSAG